MTTDIKADIHSRYLRIIRLVDDLPEVNLETSALFKRLSEGKSALIFPPPLALSQPWYEVIESDEPIPIENPFEAEEVVTANVQLELCIAQTWWKILSGANNVGLIVTHPQWNELGFQWRVNKMKVPAADASTKLCCHHDPAIDFITTSAQLKAECKFQIERRVEQLKIVHEHSKEEAIELLRGMFEKENPSPKSGPLIRRNFNLAAAKFKFNELEIRLVERKDEGLPPYPDAAETQQRIDGMIRDHLQNGWQMDGEDLFHWNWSIQRIAPAALGPEHYLDI
ncbi:hypothetical protein HNP46_006123 [Pseudomonas nitritireducens]|uniref:Uncharacterized protein n=1 Tax=Pseudomonas nitroreducens TaxID=46680 RepID=A0A7W7KQU2_PSENT|nr:hypothetical protein [Pseudomonas nitritireducens]MBB4867212.1 hypothetical protein [Pseudomonas nitritireducens]